MRLPTFTDDEKEAKKRKIRDAFAEATQPLGLQPFPIKIDTGYDKRGIIDATINTGFDVKIGDAIVRLPIKADVGYRSKAYDPYYLSVNDRFNKYVAAAKKEIVFLVIEFGDIGLKSWWVDPEYKPKIRKNFNRDDRDYQVEDVACLPIDDLFKHPMYWFREAGLAKAILPELWARINF